MKSSFFSNNRKRIVESLRGGLIIVTAYEQMQRGNDAAFAFEQDANFWWLTGIESPDWWVIIDGVRNKEWLVAPKISDSHQIFDGSLSTKDAAEVSGIDAIITEDDANKLIHELAKQHSVAYTIGDHPALEYFDFAVNPAQKKLRLKLERTFNGVQDCQLELAKLRAIKQPEEIQAIKKAIKLTEDAFTHVKAVLPTLHYEYEIEAEFSYLFRKNGAKGHAYDPIVASGKNACTLHYGENESRLKPHQLVLLDIGARLGGYAADITRTYSFGEPTKRQKEVHEAVQIAHTKIIKLLGPGLSLMEYNDSVDDIMQNTLKNLGLLNSPDSYRKYFPHAISHGLGIDVHDALGRPSHFLEGMVLTVEPGIYIPEEGIGVRIEDNILITATGRQNLSSALPIQL